MLLEGIARLHGLYDNAEHMLAETRKHRKARPVEEQLVDHLRAGLAPRAAKRRARQARKPRRSVSSVTSDLPIAVRVYPDLKPSRSPSVGRMPRSTAMLVFDCETRTEKAQALTFGSYRFLVDGPMPRRGPVLRRRSAASREAQVLERYVASTRPIPIRAAFPSESIPSNPEAPAVVG